MRRDLPEARTCKIAPPRLANGLPNSGGHGAMPEQGGKLWVRRIAGSVGHAGHITPSNPASTNGVCGTDAKAKEDRDGPCGDIKHGRRQRGWTLCLTSRQHFFHNLADLGPDLRRFEAFAHVPTRAAKWRSSFTSNP